MKRVARNVAMDVSKQTFIRSDTAIASNSYPIASSRQGGTHRERNNRYLLHANMLSLITMQQRVILDSTNVQGGASLQSAPVAAGRPPLLALTARFSSSPRPLTR